MNKTHCVFRIVSSGPRRCIEEDVPTFNEDLTHIPEVGWEIERASDVDSTIYAVKTKRLVVRPGSPESFEFNVVEVW